VHASNTFIVLLSKMAAEMLDWR